MRKIKINLVLLIVIVMLVCATIVGVAIKINSNPVKEETKNSDNQIEVANLEFFKI